MGDLHPHSFRHFAASVWYTITKDVRWIGQQLGHSSYNMTANYLSALVNDGQVYLDRASRMIGGSHEAQEDQAQEG